MLRLLLPPTHPQILDESVSVAAMVSMRHQQDEDDAHKHAEMLCSKAAEAAVQYGITRTKVGAGRGPMGGHLGGRWGLVLHLSGRL